MFIYKLLKKKNTAETDSTTSKDATKSKSKEGGIMSLMKTKEEKRRFLFQQLIAFGAILVIDIGLPLCLYYVLKMYISLLGALLISGIPPLIHVIVKFILQRKVDALGCIVVFSYVLSAILSVISGDVRLALLRDSTITCVIACAFLLTLLPINTKWFQLRPLTFLIGLQMMSELPPLTWTDKDGVQKGQHIMEFLWEKSRTFRVQTRIQTASWGICLMGEFIAKLIMIKSTMSIDDIVWISNVMVIVVIVFNTLLTTVINIMLKKKLNNCVSEWKKENDYTDVYKLAEEQGQEEEGIIPGESINKSNNNNKDSNSSFKKIGTSESIDNLV